MFQISNKGINVITTLGNDTIINNTIVNSSIGFELLNNPNDSIFVFNNTFSNCDSVAVVSAGYNIYLLSNKIVDCKNGYISYLKADKVSKNTALSSYANFKFITLDSSYFKNYRISPYNLSSNLNIVSGKSIPLDTVEVFLNLVQFW